MIKNGVFSGRYLPVFGPNTEIYSVNLLYLVRIQKNKDHKKLCIWPVFTQWDACSLIISCDDGDTIFLKVSTTMFSVENSVFASSAWWVTNFDTYIVKFVWWVVASPVKVCRPPSELSMMMGAGYSLGIIAEAKLESFLALSASFFISRHTLVYVLPKSARLRRFVASLHLVILWITIDNATGCGLSPPATRLCQASAIYQIFNALESLRSSYTLGQLNMIWH